MLVKHPATVEGRRRARKLSIAFGVALTVFAVIALLTPASPVITTLLAGAVATLGFMVLEALSGEPVPARVDDEERSRPRR